MRKMALVEVFRSVQGEGYNAGRDALFVRFAGCNLSCVFAGGALCDTPYQQARLKVTVDELFSQVIPEVAPDWGPECTFPPGGEPMFILTGGEPTLAPLFDEVVERASDYGFYTAVETNGTKWRYSLALLDHITVSPKSSVTQGSHAPYHNHNPQDPTLDLAVVHHLKFNSSDPGQRAFTSEYRYVIGGQDDPIPPYHAAHRHYVSPAVLSDGSGQEWLTGFPGFAPGALERCIAIVKEDPRWRVSLQTHKVMQVR